MFRNLILRFRLVVDLFMAIAWGFGATVFLRILFDGAGWRYMGPPLLCGMISIGFAIDFYQVVRRAKIGLGRAVLTSLSLLFLATVLAGFVLGSLGIDIHWRGYRYLRGNAATSASSAEL